MTKKKKWHHIMTVVLACYCLITITLFGVVIISSFKSIQDVLNNIWGFPKAMNFSNYAELFKKYNFLNYSKNSILITSLSLFFVIYVSSLTAYGIKIMNFKKKNLIFYFFLIGLMFPYQLGLIPLFIMVRNLSLNGSIFSIILIYASSMSLPVFIISGFLSSIPNDIIESAEIDGAGQFRIFHTIIIPLMKPIFGALIPMLGVAYWNDFFLPLIFLNKEGAKTIPLGLMKFYVGQFFDISKLNLVFTAAAVSILPILTIYFIASNKIVEGITKGAIK